MLGFRRGGPRHYAGAAAVLVATALLGRSAASGAATPVVAGLLAAQVGLRRREHLQALVFLLPHLLLLLVDLALWPLLPVRRVAGWLLGWLHRSGSVGPPALAHAGANLLAAALP